MTPTTSTRSGWDFPLGSRAAIRRRLAALALASLTALSARALTLPADWLLQPALEVRAGYDSNLFARAGGAGDGFAEIRPVLTLARPPARAAISTEISARALTFLNHAEENSVDPALLVTYLYPDQEGVFAPDEIRLSVSRSTDANADLGRRVRETERTFRWGDTLVSSAKTALQAHVELQRLSYSDWDLNTNDLAAAGLALAFISNEKLQLGAGYDFSLSRSTPALGGQRSVLREHALTFHGRGEFTPAIAGLWYVGVAHTGYGGPMARSDFAIIAGVNDTWTLRERLQLVATIDRHVYFSPLGDAVTETAAGLEIRQEFSRGFSASLGADAVHRAYRQTSVYRRDNLFPFRIGLAYTIRPEFTASLDARWSRQESDWAFRNYRRTTLAVSVKKSF